MENTLRTLSERRRWLILAIVLVAQYMFVLDASIVNVALPSIRADLHASFGQIELVVAIYQLGYAVLLVTGGRLGDLRGRRQLFLGGLAGFTLASALCGLAQSPNMLIISRLLQGLAASMLVPQVLATIQITFQGEDRIKALGIFSTVLGTAAASGQLIGGFLIDQSPLGLEWRSIFLVNVPVGIAAFVAAVIYLRESPTDNAARLDLGGVFLLALPLVLLIYPLITGRGDGWPRWERGALLAATPLLLLFVWFEARQTRRGGSPLVPLRLFRQRPFVFGLLATVALYALFGSFFFFYAVFLQSGLGDSPMRSGLIVAPGAAGFFLGSSAAPRMLNRIGTGILQIGAIIMAIGLGALLAVVNATTGRPSIPALALTVAAYGIGFGLVLSPLINIILQRIPGQDAGAASGVLLTTQQIAQALGISVLGLVFFTTKTTDVAAIDVAIRVRDFDQAFSTVLWFELVLVLATLALLLPLSDRPAIFRRRAPQLEPGTSGDD